MIVNKSTITHTQAHTYTLTFMHAHIAYIHTHKYVHTHTQTYIHTVVSNFVYRLYNQTNEYHKGHVTVTYGTIIYGVKHIVYILCVPQFVRT